MAFSNRRREKQVRLTVFNNEPLARLAEQRLRQMGIPCFIRCLRGGPGLWGSGYNLPHDLFVYASDEPHARDILELAPSEPLASDEQIHGQESAPNLWLVLGGAVLAVAVLLAMVSVFSRPTG